MSASSRKAERAIYGAIFCFALGNSGEKLAEYFLQCQLQEKIKSKKPDHHTGNTIRTNIWLYAPSIVVYLITVYSARTFKTDVESFRFTALLMGGTFLLFIFGCLWYRREKLPAESNLRKIQRICKAGLRKRKSEFPASGDCYYWKDYKQDHLYKHGEGVRLLPRVPRQFRWLDKAAIVKAEDPEELSAEMQEKKGNLCTVKEVREVKSLVPMIYLCIAFFAYSLLLACGNTFFIAQSNAAEISSRFICFIIRVAFGCFWKFEGMESGGGGRLMRKAGYIIRIGFGMSCAVICGVVAWHAEGRRLSFINGQPRQGDRNSTTAVVPQFALLGTSVGLVEGGLESLFEAHVAMSMWGYRDSFIELVSGVGQLLIIPFIFSSWVKTTVEDSRLDKLYLMLAILNGIFLLGFGYYSVRYAYWEEYPEDEKAPVEGRSENVPRPHSEDSFSRI
ncbi:unnamed protein product [Sphenostylis stenocarpa]|uniref:Uncharacterized protein n=1 Tax=Sphenostylis stenocarpa TaxID=92480 RepID=A0AA86SGL0_9FABA|nr:unnamed protein product [Sphenostylis stenocarpa]